MMCEIAASLSGPDSSINVVNPAGVDLAFLDGAVASPDEVMGRSIEPISRLPRRQILIRRCGPVNPHSDGVSAARISYRTF